MKNKITAIILLVVFLLPNRVWAATILTGKEIYHGDEIGNFWGVSSDSITKITSPGSVYSINDFGTYTAYATNNVQFVGNAKEKINSKTIVPYVKKIVSDNLEKIFDGNQELLKSDIKVIKLNARARIEMNKVKSQVGKTNRSSFDDYVIKKYRPAVNTGKKYRELFLIEGD